ncbi:MAG: anti-sigma factor family protein [Gaiellaceae bacterium]
MAEKHPDEFELLSYVEEELATDARQDVAEHLVACRSCAEHVRRLETGRTALRAAPPLELSDERRARMLAALPERREPRSLTRPLKRFLVIAAPVAAAAALIGVVVVNGPYGGSNDDGAGEAAQAEEGGGQDAAEMEASTGAADQTAPLSTTLVRNVAGPASAVVDLLAAEGISAEVNPDDGSVTAQGTAADVRAALEGRPGGIVAVYVK